MRFYCTTDPFDAHLTPSSSGAVLNTMKFTTRDRDNDLWSNNNCALHHNIDYKAGGWWYNDCTHMYANVPYNNKYKVYLNHQWQSPPFMEIKIRPKNCA